MFKKIDQKTKLVIVFVIIALIAIGGVGIYHSVHPPVKVEVKTEKKKVSKKKAVEKKVTPKIEANTPKTDTSTKPANTQEQSTQLKQATQKQATQTTPSTKKTPVPQKTQTSTPQAAQKPEVAQTKQEAAVTQSQPVKQEPSEEQIHVTITGINENFYNSDMPLKEGATAYSILSETGLSYKKTGFGSATYVRAINGLAEKDHGPLSGWMYKVNGVAPNISAGSYKLKKGDQVVWYYVNYN
ncbi:DUF4430 domain-containing protein [Sharpea azabuensis]|uniref:Transcobalamin-like C-terminal domain-containing protein n=1 Tax=Sharpea azabuensis TaxID=322505 RepID=A0A1H6TUD6_9FIRM|nr:DUF4430 domain-containing protein [Sharpea azabuensis]SEI81804.1 protein of unknown function [Sharpea azabuensis]